MQKIISRETAQARGKKRFYTGEPCAQGHDAERRVSDRKCVECVRLKKERQRRRKGQPKRGPKKRWPKIRLSVNLLASGTVSRAQAKEQGRRTYYTGFPCSRGHDAQRLTVSARCENCERLRELDRAKDPRVVQKRVEWVRRKRQQDPQYAAHLQKVIREANRRRMAIPEIREAYNAKMRLRRRTDTKFALEHRMRRGVRRAASGQCSFEGALRHLPYTIDELRNHLEAQFTDGMNWDAFLEGRIHIDHVRPLSSFDYEAPDDPQFQAAWSLDNLQPLWAEDNLRKSDRLEDGTRARAA